MISLEAVMEETKTKFTNINKLWLLVMDWSGRQE